MTGSVFAQGRYTLTSPDEKTIVTISVDDSVTYEVSRCGTTIIKESPISMETGRRDTRQTVFFKESRPLVCR